MVYSSPHNKSFWPVFLPTMISPTCSHWYSPDSVQKTSEISPCQVPTIPAYSTSDANLHIAKGAESQSLHQEIGRIDEAILHLYEERASRCRRLNETQSFEAKLPSSILIAIFYYVCPPSSYNSSHQRVRRPNGAKPLVHPVFALSGVSSRWRQIVLSVPQFWAKLDWNRKYYLSPDDTSGLLRTYFTRASPLKLDLKLTIDEKWEIENTILYDDPDKIDSHLDALRRTVFHENGEKIGKLILDAPMQWLHLLSDTFIHLSELSLRSGRIDERIDLSNLPSLTKVAFVNIKVTPILPWKRVSSIHLSHAHTNVAFELLRRCFHLTSFQSHHPNPSRNGSISQMIKETITLPYLRWLDWCCIGSHWDDTLFRFMSFPSLKQLSLSGEASWGLDWDQTLTSFLKRLPQNPPIDLELGYIRNFAGDPSPVFETIFHALGSSLQNLAVTEDGHAYLEKLVTLLTPSYSNSTSLPTPLPSPPIPVLNSPSSSSSPIFTVHLPALHVLSLRSPSPHNLSMNSLDHNPSIFTPLRGAPEQSSSIIYGDLLTEFLRQRRKVLLITQFCLNLDMNPALEGSGRWKTECKEKLRELVEEGFDLVLKEHGQRVEWL